MRAAARGAAGLLLGLTLALGPAHAGAQTTPGWDPAGAELGRQELQDLLQQLEIMAADGERSRELREQARREAEFVRTRLAEGDFQVGDRVLLEVEGEPALSDTVAVQPGRVLLLTDLDPISLDGVLRAELEEHLERELGRYVHEPVVHATSLVRIAVLGQVRQQGFYTMPASLLIEEALMLAGGPAPNAGIDKVEIRRGERVIWKGEPLQEAIIAGRTLDQLSLQAGDRIFVPQRVPGFFERGIVRTLLVTVPPLVWLVYRLRR